MSSSSSSSSSGIYCCGSRGSSHYRRLCRPWWSIFGTIYRALYYLGSCTSSYSSSSYSSDWYPIRCFKRCNKRHSS